MKNQSLLHACLLSTLGILSASYAQADEPNAYEQRYGANAYVPPATYVAPSTQSKLQAGSGLPSTNAYLQRYGAPSSETNDVPAAKRAEIDVSAIYDNDPSSNIKGGSSAGIETTAYSATLAATWRIFAGELFMHENEPFGEGNIDFSRTSAGVEYDNNVVKFSLAPTFNKYGRNERVGANGDVRYTIDDHWEVGGGAQLFSRDVPLRALNAGVTANSYNLNGDWYQRGIRNVRADIDATTFSDGNTRTALTLADTEHLFVSSRYTVDGLASASESQNSADENRDYFNPKQDVLGLLGARITQPLYNASGFAYEHSLDVRPGFYWQKNYGTSGAIVAGYTHHLKYRNDIDAALGLNFTRQSIDNTPENDLAILFNLSKKL